MYHYMFGMCHLTYPSATAIYFLRGRRRDGSRTSVFNDLVMCLHMDKSVQQKHQLVDVYKAWGRCQVGHVAFGEVNSTAANQIMHFCLAR